MENSSVCRRTRLQEQMLFEKYSEEKCGKMVRKRKRSLDGSRNCPNACRKGEGGIWDGDFKRKNVLQENGEREDDIICLGENDEREDDIICLGENEEQEDNIVWSENRPGKRSLSSTQRKELEEKRSCGDTDGDVVILAEEVVSNEKSARVSSSLASGMNSRCVRERSSLESPEVVSACLRDGGECILLSEDSSEAGGSEDGDDECSESEVSTEVTSDDPDDEDFVLEVKDLSVTLGGEEEGEENNGDGDDVLADRNICVSGNGERNVVEELNLDYRLLDELKDGERYETLKKGKHKVRKHKQVIEDGLIRQTRFGMDILSSCNNKGTNLGEGIAKRLRSRSLSRSKRKMLKLGTISHPLSVDDKLDSSSDLNDKHPSAVNYKMKSSSDSEDIIESSTDSEGMPESSSQEDIQIVHEKEIKVGRTDIQRRNDKRKRKSKKASTSHMGDLANIISEKIFLESSFVEQKVHSKLPIKFTFEDDPVVQEKEEWEKENDAVFVEMELVLKALEIGFSDPSLDDSSSTTSSEIEAAKPSLLELCCEGNHDLKLEDDIGMICRNCSYVLEMKYIFPDFAKDPFRRSQKKIIAADVETDRSFVNRLKFPDYCSKGNSPSGNVKGTVWDLIPGMKEKMYPHQHEGFEFIWEHLAGGIRLDKLSLNDSLANARNGCIINHAPGTGKTCLVIVFLLSFMRLHPKCSPLIVAPYSMLRNWEEEFQKWNVNIPFYNLNNNQLSPKEYEKATELFGNVGLDNKCSRLLKCSFWRQEQSILAIGYQLFVKLAGEHEESKIGEESGKVENGLMRKILLELPDILVLDEGHTARNENTLIWKALSEMKTKRRIILSGTLFQNNFTELYNTLCLANPNFASHLSSKFVNRMNRSKGFRKRQPCDLANEEWLSLTNSIVWKGDDGGKYKEMNYPFVHVYKGAILLELPGMKDSRIDLRPTALQVKLLNIVKNVPNYLRRKSLMSSVSIHPSLVSDCHEFSEDDRAKLKKLASNPDAGVKTKFLVGLIQLCEALHERVLIFCTYVKPLKLIMCQLKSQFNWVEGRELLQMDGNADQEQRKSIISLMNDPDSDVRVLLASTKASNEGINLVGASRVVILDVGFNPSVETQAISRAHRIGQKKVVYVYHLITSETLEVDYYHSQNMKEHISKLVFSSKSSSGCCGASDGKAGNPPTPVLQDKVLELMFQHESLKNMFEQIYERPGTN